MLTENKKLY